MKSSKRSRSGPRRDRLDATFFETPAAFRAWLEARHATDRELWIGFHRKGAGPVGLDYSTAVELALCFGWIDGVRKKLDATSYTNRFTPRKPGSTWSRVNIARVERLRAAGQMHEAGLAAYARRDEARSGIYSFEQRPEALPPELERRFRRHRTAWAHFGAQPPGYRRLSIWWISSAKREETRLRRLEQLIEASAAGRRLGVLFGQTGTVPTPEKPKSSPTRRQRR